MISKNSTPMPMEVLSQFYTGLIDGKQLTVSDIKTGLSRGKLLTIENNWLFHSMTTQPLQPHHWHQAAKSILKGLE